MCLDIGIKNQVDIPQISSPVELVSKLSVFSNIKLKNEETNLFSSSLVILNNQLFIDRIDLKNIRSINIIFTNNFEYEFYCNTYSVLGMTKNIIVYAMDRLRNRNVDGYKYIAVYLEELIHHFYNTEDEQFVKKKIFDACINSNLKVTKQQLFFYEDGWIQ